MNIFIENEWTGSIDYDYTVLINKVITETLHSEACPYEVEVSVLITDDNSVQETNREFRRIDSSTDVLSFPAHEYTFPAYYEELKETEGDFSPESGELLLGDIMISYEHVIKQAAEYGHSEQREISFLTVHSVLHLLGYDHVTEEERNIMEQKQEAVLQNLGITRE